jgi:predicted PurR-regulated permease PerM
MRFVESSMLKSSRMASGISPEQSQADLRKQIADAALFIATGFAFYLCWLLARPFLSAITWALALAVIGYPLQRRLEGRLRPNPAALISVITIAILLLAPGFSLLRQIYREAADSLTMLSEYLNPVHLSQAMGQSSLPQRFLEWLASRFDLNQELRRAASVVAGQLPAALKGSMQFVTQFVVMLLVLFYFLRDHKRLLQYAARLSPLSAAETGQLFGRISETIYATLYGNVAVKVVQGTLGGLMFWILGLPNPALFGAAMAVLATLPLLGASLVWGTAAVLLLLQGSWVKALVLTLWGALVVSLIDNLLYPILIASELRLHALGIFLAVFGGLIAFGIAGVVLGPVILATTVALLEVWRVRTGDPSAESEKCD